ncbi:MAG: SDR family oxidoreductase [Acetobacteraceae bacterium]|nr:SDR family oxidoreductase [Acetobacteraceae bacterium]
MDLQLHGKRALVTGSSRGIGAAVARALAEEGARVVVHGRDRPSAERVVGLIQAAGGSAIAVLGDLTATGGAARVAREATEQLGGVDILVNNAGVYAGRGWFETSPESWRDFYESDVVSAVRLVQALAPGMRRAGWGRIINVATGMATTPQAMMADYAAAKAAMVNMTVGLAKALAGSGVTVNTVSPGVIHTDGVEAVLREEAARRGWGDDWGDIQRRWFDDVLNDRTVDRLGAPEEIAALVAFVASPRAGYVNGANLRVDGGKSPAIN